MLCLLIPLIVSCATIGNEIKSDFHVVDSSCKWVKPIYISKSDVLTEGTTKQILALNNAYVALCGKP